MIDIGMLYASSTVILFMLVLAKSSDQAFNESLAFADSSDIVYPESWISDLFYQVLANFSVRNVGNTACQKQGEMIDKHLRNHTNWAVKMAESWERHPVGILGGNRYHFGVYDECVAVNYPVKGQYCLSEVKLAPVTKNNYSSNRKENQNRIYNAHAWKTILEWVYLPDQGQRNILNFGICIPDSCTASDLQISLQKEMNKVFLPKKVDASVKVDQIMCTIKENTYPYDRAYFITSAIFGFLVVICCGTTIYHYISLSCNQNKNEACDNNDSFIYSFSLIKSIKELLHYNKDNELNILNGFKVLTMMFILFGHRFMYLAGNPLVYAELGEDIYFNGPDIILTSMNLVDPFFFISGFLMYLSLYPIFEKTGAAWMKLTFPITYRIVRMLPAYCAMMAITAHIVPHLGDGPLWPHKVWDEAEKCKNYWWTNLLFISNLIDVKYQCLIVSWYLSCDIQFFLIGIIIVYVYMKNFKYGIGMLITALGVSLSLPFIVTLLTKSDGILKVHVPFLENPRSSKTFNEIYRPSYMRGAPYFIGLTVGFVIEKLKETKFKLSQKSVYGGTFIVIVISVWIQLYGSIFYLRHRPYYPLEHALYSVLSHCTWSIIGVWILVCHFTTGYGLLSKVLTNRVVVIMGRLSYSVFLVNLTVMMVSQSSQRTVQHLSIKSSLDAWIYDTFKCYLMGLLLHLIIEAPFGSIIRKLFGRGKQKKSSSNEVSAVASPKITEAKGTNFELNNV